jgi:hypothetical protein
MDQLQSDYARLKPTCLELEQQLEMEKRLHLQREAELMACKKVQQEMLNAEIDRFNQCVVYSPVYFGRKCVSSLLEKVNNKEKDRTAACPWSMSLVAVHRASERQIPV